MLQSTEERDRRDSNESRGSSGDGRGFEDSIVSQPHGDLVTHTPTNTLTFVHWSLSLCVLQSGVRVLQT